MGLQEYYLLIILITDSLLTVSVRSVPELREGVQMRPTRLRAMNTQAWPLSCDSVDLLSDSLP